ncbi:MAG: hypothetical protein JW940_39235 [Polyangiaceae bacterium]|nr:hypothetical protein [Polyangiaceae bacterium]
MQTPFSEFVRTVEALDPRHPRVRRWTQSPELGPRPGGLAALRAELMAEAAAALGRAEQRVLAELERLRSMGESIDQLETQAAAASDGIDPSRHEALAHGVDAFNRQRRVAQRRLWELMVQREALGLYRNDILAELYPIPARRSIAATQKP